MHYFDIVIIAFFALSLAIMAYTILTSRRYKSPDIDLQKEAIKVRNCWLRASILCIILYYWCILCSIFSTLTVLHISCYEDLSVQEIKSRVIFLSILSIFTSICPYVVDLKKMAKIYREAFCILDKAILENGDVAEAITLGEKAINPIV